MKLYNSLSGKIKDFKPINRGKVLMYVCGITPYDTTHLGHAFTYVVFDTLQKYFKAQGLKVNYVQNVTDIDDDILKRAKRDHRDWKELGQFWTDKFLSDLKALNVDLPTHYVKATDSIPKIIEMVSLLINKGFAYEKSGNIYFKVKQFPNYGQLSKLSRTKMISLSMERGGDPQDPRKSDPLDFLLWQKSGLGEPWWDSPWGKGRPGWHIECSAMIDDYLGAQIDIHGGGGDLIYPHHESEIAQSQSFTGKIPFVQIWMHTGILQYKGQKMSKSLGNLVMVSDLLKSYSANTIRINLLSHHYRKPWEYSDVGMKTSRRLSDQFSAVFKNRKSGKIIDQKIFAIFKQFLENDFDTPKALKFTQIIANKIKKTDERKLKNTLARMLTILGLNC